MMDYAAVSLQKHGEWRGKIEVTATVPVQTQEDLSLAYTPGVAQPCLEIQRTRTRATPSPGGTIYAPSLPTAPPFWAWGTSARRPGCP